MGDEEEEDGKEQRRERRGEGSKIFLYLTNYLATM